VQLAVTEDTEAPPTTQGEDGAITWSVSDLTSDCESMISSLPLDRIDEEEEQQSDDYTNEGPQSPFSNIKKLEFVPSWESQKVSYVPHEVNLHDVELGAFPNVAKADISWLEDKNDDDDVNFNSNESLEVSEGTLLGCAFIDDGKEKLLEGTDESSVATTPRENKQKKSFGNDEHYHSPTSEKEGNSSVLSSDSEDELEYMSPRQSLATQVMHSPRASPTKAPSPKGLKDADSSLITWARDALTKIKNGEVPTFRGEQPE